MKLPYLGLMFLVVFSFCRSTSSKRVETIDHEPNGPNRPVRSNDENSKLICFLSMTDYQNSKNKVKHMGERLISITDNILERGDSISYSFNFQNQLIRQEVYSNKGQLKEITSFHRNSLAQIKKITSRSFRGGTPMSIKYTYNKLSQIIEERNSGEHSYKRFTYDAKNYLIRKELLNINDSLIEITSYLYDTRGNLTLILTKSNSGDTISADYYKYNELSQNSEREHTGEPINCAGRNKWYIKYNKLGNKLEEKTHDLTVRYNYEYDKNNNWTKQYNYYGEDKAPNFLITRKIEYFD